MKHLSTWNMETSCDFRTRRFPKMAFLRYAMDSPHRSTQMGKTCIGEIDLTRSAKRLTIIPLLLLLSLSGILEFAHLKSSSASSSPQSNTQSYPLYQLG